MPELSTAPLDTPVTGSEKLLTLEFKHIPVPDLGIVISQYLDAAQIPFASSAFSADNVEDAIIEASGGGGGGGAELDNVNEFTANQYVAPVALTDGATINVNAALSNNFTVTLGGNRTLANPTNLEPGMVLNFQITQDGTGSRTLAYGSNYNWPGGTAPTLSTAAGAVDVISAISFNGTVLQCVAQLAFS